MMYLMKSGILYREPGQEALMKIKSSLICPTKKICRDEAGYVLQADICCPDPEKRHTSDVRNKEYVLTEPGGKVVGKACPNYAPGDDPNVVGWPISHMPRVDRAHTEINGDEYFLVMHNSQNYGLQDSNGEEILRILHRGIAGGWRIECRNDFSPEILCGLFVFCRFLEQENEFLIV